MKPKKVLYSYDHNGRIKSANYQAYINGIMEAGFSMFRKEEKIYAFASDESAKLFMEGMRAGNKILKRYFPGA